MFRTTISSSPFVNDTANDFFQNIYGDKFSDDVSFLATLRALVSPRMSNDDHLSLRFGGNNYTARHIGDTSASNAVRTVCEYFSPNDEGSIYIHSLRSSVQEDNYACLELLKSTFCKVYRGWHRLEKVTDFYRKQFYVMCFINPDIKSAVIFVDNMDMRKMHYIQCSIFAFLPWYFNPDEGVSELEMKLIDSLRQKTSTQYEEVIDIMSKQYDFKSARIKKLLAGFETRYEHIECDRVRGEIENIIRMINSLNSEIGENLKRKNDMEIKLLGLETKIANGDESSEIMDYFLCNDKLVLIDVTDNKMVFAVKSYIEYYDEDMVASVLNNRDSYIYRPRGSSCNNYIPAEDMEKFIRAVFIDQTLKIRFCAAYQFDLNGNVSPKRGYHFNHEFNGYMPNTHINEYGCMGNYPMVINQMLEKRDYIGAIEQCVASNKSLNFRDSTVMSKFMSNIYGLDGANNKCVELPDGKVVNTKEAIEWLKEQERGSNE